MEVEYSCQSVKRKRNEENKSQSKRRQDKREKQKIERHEKRKHSIQNLWNMAKAALREKFVTINIYIKKRSHVNNLTACIKK